MNTRHRKGASFVAFAPYPIKGGQVMHVTEITIRVKTREPLDPENLPTVYHLVKNIMVGDAEWVKVEDEWEE